MNNRIILLCCLLALAGKAYTQESSIVVTSANDIIQVVQKANLMLNKECRENERSSDVMQKRITKEIYSTKDVLFSIRDMIVNQKKIQMVKYKHTSYEVNALNNSLSSLNDTLSDQQLYSTISEIKQKAIKLRRKLRRYKN